MGGEVGRMGVGDGGNERGALCGVEDGEEGGRVVGRWEDGDGVEDAPGVGRLWGLSCWLGGGWCGRRREVLGAYGAGENDDVEFRGGEELFGDVFGWVTQACYCDYFAGFEHWIIYLPNTFVDLGGEQHMRVYYGVFGFKGALALGPSIVMRCSPFVYIFLREPRFRLGMVLGIVRIEIVRSHSYPFSFPERLFHLDIRQLQPIPDAISQ